MEIDRNKLSEALSDPVRLQTLARQIATAMGLPEDRAVALAKNTDLIKARLATMSEADLRNMVQMLPPEKAAEIMKLVGGNNG
ncbi:MAG: hypothetical protein IJ519_01050 [Clostridia bacterium]|nr:hypothetical protein [Clostridia bacterium]